MSAFKKSILSNGVRVVTETHPHSKSVSIGVWVLTGTRDEAEDQVGLSHFVEHLVFKGTKTRSAYQIAKSLESLGGDLNAYTTREYTNYHCLVLKEDWKLGLEVLADLVCNMDLAKKDFELEKKVILQEIAMCDDADEEIIYDHFYAEVYKNHPLSRQILGQSETIQQMTQKKVIDFYKKYYQDEIVLAEAFDQSKIDEEDRFSVGELVMDLKKIGKKAQSFQKADDIVSFLKTNARRGDVILIMSNGGFDGIYQKLLTSLA